MHALSSERIATIEIRTAPVLLAHAHTHTQQTANCDMKGWDLNMDFSCDLL